MIFVSNFQVNLKIVTQVVRLLNPHCPLQVALISDSFLIGDTPYSRGYFNPVAKKELPSVLILRNEESGNEVLT